MSDGNLATLATYEALIQAEEDAYAEMLKDLEGAEPDDYESIIEEHGWGDTDITTILKDLL